MKIYPYQLIPVLPRQQLLYQHQICAALRGKYWGRKNCKVDYVFRYTWEHLFQYHIKVLNQMTYRGYSPNLKWFDFYYRGKHCDPVNPYFTHQTHKPRKYPEHNITYLKKFTIELHKKISSAPEKKYNLNEIYNFYNFTKKIFPELF